MNRIYTMQDMERDGTFNAEPGQQVESEIYRFFLNLMPIRHLPENEITAKYQSGFMMYEPYDDPSSHKTHHACFGRGKDGRYYFIGYLSI